MSQILALNKILPLAMGIGSKMAVDASSLHISFSFSSAPNQAISHQLLTQRSTLEHVELYKLIWPKWMLSKHIGYSSILAISIMQVLNQTRSLSLSLSPQPFSFSLFLFFKYAPAHAHTYKSTFKNTNSETLHTL